jgi:chromosomal replication initiation ATPase DnaA|tara:strand:- start:563 stop:1240 length:678 start_codon:yes stop_codon:yes gene_type:complete
MESEIKNLNQQLLNFDLEPNYAHDDFFVSKSNYFAYNLILNWPKWEKNIINLNGDKFCGKTHLTKIFIKKFKAFKIDAKNLSDEKIKEFKIHQNFVLENFDQNSVNEKLIYSLINIVEQDNKYLIINSRKALNKYSFKLNDLNSRLKNCLNAKIELPDDSLMFAIILKNFSDRQIFTDKKIINYVIKNIDRSYSKICEFIYKVDQVSLQKQKPVTIKTIKEALKI